MRKQNRINRVEERMRKQSSETDPIRRAVRKVQRERGFDPIKEALREVDALRDTDPPGALSGHDTGESS